MLAIAAFDGVMRTKQTFTLLTGALDKSFDSLNGSNRGHFKHWLERDQNYKY
jgi:hypothetical protein